MFALRAGEAQQLKVARDLFTQIFQKRIPLHTAAQMGCLLVPEGLLVHPYPRSPDGLTAALESDDTSVGQTLKPKMREMKCSGEVDDTKNASPVTTRRGHVLARPMWMSPRFCRPFDVLHISTGTCVRRTACASVAERLSFSTVQASP